MENIAQISINRNNSDKKAIKAVTNMQIIPEFESGLISSSVPLKPHFAFR